MKTCAMCTGRLGLGVRFKNYWSRFGWRHVRFCSAFCEHNYELERNEEARRKKYLAFLARPS
jgi:hypothetical protein